MQSRPVISVLPNFLNAFDLCDSCVDEPLSKELIFLSIFLCFTEILFSLSSLHKTEPTSSLLASNFCTYLFLHIHSRDNFLEFSPYVFLPFIEIILKRAIIISFTIAIKSIPRNNLIFLSIFLKEYYLPFSAKSFEILICLSAH